MLRSCNKMSEGSMKSRQIGDDRSDPQYARHNARASNVPTAFQALSTFVLSSSPLDQLLIARLSRSLGPTTITSVAYTPLAYFQLDAMDDSHRLRPVARHASRSSQHAFFFSAPSSTLCTWILRKLLL